MRVIAPGQFNLCPSEACHPVDGDSAAPSCEVPKAAAPVEFLPYPEVPREAVEQAARSSAPAGSTSPASSTSTRWTGARVLRRQRQLEPPPRGRAGVRVRSVRARRRLPGGGAAEVAVVSVFKDGRSQPAIGCAPATIAICNSRSPVSGDVVAFSGRTQHRGRIPRSPIVSAPGCGLRPGRVRTAAASSTPSTVASGFSRKAVRRRQRRLVGRLQLRLQRGLALLQRLPLGLQIRTGKAVLDRLDDTADVALSAFELSLGR